MYQGFGFQQDSLVYLNIVNHMLTTFQLAPDLSDAEVGECVQLSDLARSL